MRLVVWGLNLNRYDSNRYKKREREREIDRESVKLPCDFG